MLRLHLTDSGNETRNPVVRDPHGEVHDDVACSECSPHLTWL